MRRLICISLAALLASGCFTRTIAEKMGVSGWFRCDGEGKTYKSRFTGLDLLSPGLACPSVRDTDKPIVVLVHGVGGDGPEMEEVVPKLAAWGPAALYMLRWVPYDDRDAISARIAKGVSRLAECAPDRQIVVIAHSAGGVVTSLAAAQIVAGPTLIHVLTVASPLAGTVRRAGNPDGSQEATMMLDLGTRIAGYPPAAANVHVAHLRTHAPADHIMVPSGDLLPNDPKIGVPNGEQLELPGELSHSGALGYVVDELIAGRAAGWLNAKPPDR
ncbi:MAG: hypothetical protein IPJ65_42475 [Archangiaceae bacterium]|nr:hypothetical protein [Archangiaceae bacterium]